MSDRSPPDDDAPGLGRLVTAALGIVYGDIGTSPLYTIRECFGEAHGLAPGPANVMGLLSLILWSLVVVVTLKYVAFVLRADNHGEGGIFALMSLARAAPQAPRRLVVAAGIFGAALFFGDGAITPAISVLSAVEGLGVATPVFEPYVMPLAIAVLTGLFWVQSRGTEKVGAWFGPVMLLWFAVLGALGVRQIVEQPSVLGAIDPRYGVAFFAANGFAGFAVLGSVVLAVTGAEALYADIGHFGTRPVRLGWLGCVLPALALNYMGQGALLLQTPDAVRNPFFLLAPHWLLLPLVVLSTLAAIIASQAVISGVFSLTQQAIHLGFSPPMRIRHTSRRQMGQIFIPDANLRLFVAVIALVVFFRSSSGLAGAYGIAVTGTMVVTSLLAYVVARRIWGWSLVRSLVVVGGFLVFDLAFMGATLLKVANGGWLPISFAIVLCVLMATWRRGRTRLRRRARGTSVSLHAFFERSGDGEPVRVPGTAVYLTASPRLLPQALVQNIKHNKVLHERVVLLTMLAAAVPRVAPHHRSHLDRLRPDVLRLVVRYGFMETPDVPRALAEAGPRHGLAFDLATTSFLVGRETVVASPDPPLSGWRERVFILMAQTAASGGDVFRLPSDRVLEIGTQVPV